MESAALSSAGAPRASPTVRSCFADLRETGPRSTGEEVPKLTELHRVSPGQIVMAAATFLGFYLIVTQFAGIDIWATLQTAEWEWVVVAASAVAAPAVHRRDRAAGRGRDTAPLRTGRRRAVREQLHRPHRRHAGERPRSSSASSRSRVMKVAVAASSGRAELARDRDRAGDARHRSACWSTGRTSPSPTPAGQRRPSASIIVIGIIVSAVSRSASRCSIPKLRRWCTGIVQPQIQAAQATTSAASSRTPRKAAMLFGGNLASQVIFALVLDASLHAYG